MTLATRLKYNVHRWYQPGTGRYTRVDPLQGDPNFPGVVTNGWAGLKFLGIITQHPYEFAAANPLVSVDPSGLLGCHGKWTVYNWWRLGDPPSASPAPISFGRRGPQLPPANRIPNARGPNPVTPPGPGPVQLIPPGICYCRWNCIPCEGGMIFDPKRLPVTVGLTINTGRDVASGDTCLCMPPGPTTGCDEDYVCKAPPFMLPRVNVEPPLP